MTPFLDVALDSSIATTESSSCITYMNHVQHAFIAHMWIRIQDPGFLSSDCACRLFPGFLTIRLSCIVTPLIVLEVEALSTKYSYYLTHLWHVSVLLQGSSWLCSYLYNLS